MTSISNLGSTGSTGSSVLSTQGGKFDDNSFLQILVTQLRNQTPLEPVDNGAFMDQMASFSSMEQQRDLNDNLLQLLNFQGALAKIQGLSEGSNLLGKEITYDPGDGSQKVGNAESVYVDQSGEVKVVVNSEEITLKQITGISQTSTNP